MDPDQQLGLYDKYTVIDNAKGVKVEEFTFTLVPEKDPIAVSVLAAYAVLAEKDFPQLSADIKAKLHELGFGEGQA